MDLRTLLSRPRPLLLLGAVLSLSLGAPLPAQAPYGGLPPIQSERDDARSRMDEAEQEERVREMLEAAESMEAAERDTTAGPRPAARVGKKTIPLTNANGERLVGVVDTREFTETEMRRRANLLMGLSPMPEPTEGELKAYSPDNPNMAAVKQMMMDDRRITFESTVLQEWVKVTTLAVHAERTGISVSDPEIDQALNDLAQLSNTGGDQQRTGMSMIGVAERDLRREVRDSILVEKLLDRTLAETVSEAQKRAIFAKTPAAFLPSPKVRAWQLFLPQVGRMTSEQTKKVTREMKAIGKLLKRAKGDEASFEALRDQLKREHPGYTLSDLGWVEGDATSIPLPTANLLFTTDAGDVSDTQQLSLGLFMVRVFERQEGGNTFEEALPQLDNALHNQLRDLLYEQVRGRYKVRHGASGLNQIVDKTAAEIQHAQPSTPPPMPAITQPEPDLDALRRARETTPPAGVSLPVETQSQAPRPAFSNPPPLVP